MIRERDEISEEEDEDDNDDEQQQHVSPNKHHHHHVVVLEDSSYPLDISRPSNRIVNNNNNVGAFQATRENWKAAANEPKQEYSCKATSSSTSLSIAKQAAAAISGSASTGNSSVSPKPHIGGGAGKQWNNNQ